MELNDTNELFDNFFTVVNDLDTYAPYKKLSQREIKLKKNMVDERHKAEKGTKWVIPKIFSKQ